MLLRVPAKANKTGAAVGNRSSYQMKLGVVEDVAMENFTVVDNNGGYGGYHPSHQQLLNGYGYGYGYGYRCPSVGPMAGLGYYKDPQSQREYLVPFFILLAHEGKE